MYERLSRDTKTKGGSMETETNAFAVIPWVRSACRAVTTVTPLANRPKAARNLTGSTERGAWIGSVSLVRASLLYGLRTAFLITRLMSSGVIRSGTVQPSRSYSAMHFSAKPLYFADWPVMSATIRVSKRMLS